MGSAKNNIENGNAKVNNKITVNTKIIITTSINPGNIYKL